MEVSKYNQMMAYLTRPRERFQDGDLVEGEELISYLKDKKDRLGRPNISEYQEKLKILKELQEKQYINPKTKKPFTPKEWLELYPANRTKFRNLETFLKKKREYQKDYMKRKKKDPEFREKFLTKKKELYYRTERKKPKFTQIKKGYAALMEERNRLLNYMYMASKDNPNYKEIIKDGSFVGIKDKQNGVNYYEAGYEGKLGKNSKLITSHPSFENTKNLLKLAREFKTSLPNKAISSYFSSYERVPTLAEMQNFLQADPRFVSKMSPQYFKTNPLHLHHQISITDSPTEKISLLLQDRNDQAGKKMIEFKKGNITEKQLNSDLKKLNTRYYINNKPIGAKETLPKTQLKTAKTQVTKLFNKRLAENPKLIEEMTRTLGILGCPGKAMGGRIGFQEGTTPSTQCVRAGANIINDGNFKNLSQGQRINAERFLNRAYKLGRGVVKFGVVPEAIFVAGESLLRIGMGDTFEVDFKRATDYLRTGDQTLEADASKISRTLFDQDAGNLFKSVSNFRKTKKDLEGAQVNLDVDLAQNNPEFSGMSDEDVRKIGEDRIKKAKDDFFNAQISKEQQVLSDYQFDQARDISEAKSFFTAQKLKGSQMELMEDDPLQIDLGFAPEQKQSPFIDVRSILTETPKTIADKIQEGYQSGVYGQTGLEKSFEKAKQDYRNTLKQYFNIKDAPISELAASPLVGAEQIYGANPENFLQKRLPAGASYDPRLAYDFAGGGIAKLAGVDSGPPPEKGPTPQGLDLLLNRGRR